MRILFLSQRFVLPMDTGGKIRTGNILRQLSCNNDVTLVSNFDPEKDDPYRDRIEEMCARFVPVNWRETERHSVRYLARVALYGLSRYPISVLNDSSSALERAVLKEHARGEHDIAICDFVQSARMFERVVGIPRLLFTHNVESVILERHMGRAQNSAARAFWRSQWRKMLAFESATCRAYDSVIAVSEVDKDTFQSLYGLVNVETIPTGVDVDYFSPARTSVSDTVSLVFCGSMDWLPNEDGIIFFVESVLPRVQREVRDATLTVVGRNPSPRLRAAVEGRVDVKLTGWVDDTRPWLSRATLYVVPIRIGGGTRMKIYEAMAMGLPIVSTSIGAEGLDVRDGDNIVIADDAATQAREIVALLRDESRRSRIGANARLHVEGNFAWSRVAKDFQDICEQTVSRVRSGICS